MADLPLSLRSARLLLEAEKGGPRVIDRALKAIAIFETKGVVSKEFAGECYSSSSFKSDLLNQLDLWEDQRRNAGLISRKRAALAREIYGELKKRLGVQPARGALSLGEQKHLFRAVLSGFCDGVYFKGEGIYWREGEERQIERTSILNPARPEMVVGLPFDLVIHREDQRTGSREERTIPLLTFCSEISLQQLDDLRPFSYEKRRSVTLQEDRLKVSEEIFFGSRLIKAVEVEPDWTRPDEKHAIMALALEWFEKNYEDLPGCGEIKKNRAWFAEAERALGEKLPSFDIALREYLYRQLRRSLKIDDLRFFFQFHPALQRLSLRQLLPFRWLKKLKQARWPGRLEIKDMDIPIVYLGGRPFLELDHARFHRLEAADTRLPSGEAPGFLLQGEKFASWAEAAAAYNARLKDEIFRRKWQGVQKTVQVGDILNIPFPLAFQGGNGKDNQVFEFYSAPAFRDDAVFLVHFNNQEEARAHFATVAEEWERRKARFRKESVENIFRRKGWKVK
jgi:hypothetical protein